MNMFCFQCQETARGEGCTVRGVCGKTEDVANLQDLLIYVLKGISVYAEEAKKFGIQDEQVGTFITRGLFSTITNVSFDPEDFVEKGQDIIYKNTYLIGPRSVAVFVK